MNIFDLQERLHNSAFVGAGIIGEDFRLKKAIDEFGEISSKNAVFTKIYQLVKPLNDDSTEDKKKILLDAITFVDAVCATLAVTAKPEETTQIEQNAEDNVVMLRRSEVGAVITALTTGGSGRYQIVKNAYESGSKVFEDYRVREYLYNGIFDQYSEMGILCGEIFVKKFGKKAVEFLKKDFDKKGRTESVRKLQAISFAGAEENDFYKSLASDSETSASVRCAAVNAMRCDRENRSFLEALSEEKIPATLATEIKYTFAFWKRQEEEEKKKQAENK